jgi:hypothetical protein
MLMRKIFVIIAAGILSISVLAGCTQGPEIITLTHAAGTSNSVPVDANPDGVQGDYSVFDSPVYRDGKLYGSMIGSLTKVGALGSGTHPEREERLVSAIFDLPDGQINVMGLSFYNPEATKMERNEPYVRAIVGGTGAYVGARGEVETIHNDDDTYTHTIKLWK